MPLIFVWYSWVFEGISSSFRLEKHTGFPNWATVLLFSLFCSQSSWPLASRSISWVLVFCQRSWSSFVSRIWSRSSSFSGTSSAWKLSFISILHPSVWFFLAIPLKLQWEHSSGSVPWLFESAFGLWLMFPQRKILVYFLFLHSTTDWCSYFQFSLSSWLCSMPRV